MLDLDPLVRVGLIFLGAGHMLPPVLAFDNPYVSGHTIVGTAIAWVGWRSRENSRAVQTYMAWALMLTVALLLSSVSVWARDAMQWTVTNSLWLLFIVPGIAYLMTHRRYRQAFFVGIAIGVVAYEVTLARWLAQDGLGAIFRGAGRGVTDVLGANRNDVDGFMLVAIALALWLSGLPRSVRWPVAGMGVLWLISAGGRLGLVALAAVGLSYALMQPRLGRRARTVSALLLAGAVLMVATSMAPSGRFVATNRVLDYLRGDRTQVDEQRTLGNRYGWDVGARHPLFGVGYKRIGGIGYTPTPSYESPVLDEASSTFVRDRLRRFGPHNIYIWFFATAGIPGALALIGLVGAVILIGLRSRAAPDARAAVAALIAAVITAAAIRTTLAIFFLPMALVIGAAAEYAARLPPRNVDLRRKASDPAAIASP